MGDEAFNWMTRIKAVEREYGVIRFGTERLILHVNDDPSILGTLVKRPDIAPASDRLEGTYIIRVFAEFETALQHFCRTFNIRRPGMTEALVNRVMDRGKIPQPEADLVHDVRDYRNTLVHERTRPATAVTIREATKRLCSFLSRVQRIW